MGLNAAILCLCLFCLVWATQSQIVRQNVTITDSGGFSLPAVLVRPATGGPFPAMVVLHGVGGMWSSSNNGNMISNFEEWAQILPARNIVAIFPDSYTPRGFSDFRSRRPAEDPNVDDSPISPAYVRPEDAFRAMRYLRGLTAFVQPDLIGVMGFSHGAETSLSSVLDLSINKTAWTVSYMFINGSIMNNYPVPAPPRAGGPSFKFCIAWYPGCGFYSYYGSVSSTAAGNYMPSVPTLMFHGTADPLFTSGYPPILTAKSAAQASSLGRSSNPITNVTFDNAAHSFDQVTAAAPGQQETADQAAKRLARQQALSWIDTYLLASNISPTSSSGSSPVASGSSPTANGGGGQSPVSGSPSSGQKAVGPANNSLASNVYPMDWILSLLCAAVGSLVPWLCGQSDE
eukprot:TRINITY_DN10158_c0_g1_i1.p1 TRINITY_DN10158_c0_g1~~TRINITY_DN10158_c0_g1_i1.p1  ORF type:complete len:402 (+),score=39.85 TRINITY_DN10158_c0_g1_i1:20-1225(+)